MSFRIDTNNPVRIAVLKAFRATPNATLRELADQVGVTPAAVQHHLKNLEADGTIVRPEGTRSSKLSEQQLQKRIDMVVEKAKEHEVDVQHDVVRHINRPLRMRTRMRGIRNFGGD